MYTPNIFSLFALLFAASTLALPTFLTMILSSEAPATAIEPSSPPPMAMAAEQPASPATESPREGVANTTAGGACSPAVLALADGIRANIAVQNNEFAGASSLSAMLTENPVDTTLFAAGQASLLKSVKEGIVIRQNNQRITPMGNAATAGLATVAMAQMTELNLTMGLGMGGVDVSRDNKTVGELLGDFKGGIEQNMKNLAAAMSGCTATAGGASNGTAPAGGAPIGTGTPARPSAMPSRLSSSAGAKATKV